MARSIPQHKQNYVSFIDPDYAKVSQVNGWEIAKEFQAFQDTCFEQIPDEGAPADGYKYNSHMGAFVRSLDEAKDHFLKGKLAFYARRGSGTPSPPAPKQ
jgi:hypothetical protein